MENSFPSDAIELPPGFRFHPTDEELITHYLSPKVLNPSFSALAIADADFNQSEPWDLPRRAKIGGREWYFFCVRDRKYPTGLRTNRATVAGYWKATGKDKEIFKANALIGMKKTLVFYLGRAPKGEKTNWIMHEYRLHPKLPHDHDHDHDLSSKNEWVLCRVFHKINSGGKKMMVEIGASSSELPPLMEASPPNQTTEFGESSHVTCFSRHPNQVEDPMMTRDGNNNIVVDGQVGNNNNNNNNSSSKMPNSFLENNGWGDFDGDISSVIYNSNSKEMILHRSFHHNQQYYSSASAGPDDIGSLWNYST